jgi:hypothetical protein
LARRVGFKTLQIVKWVMLMWSWHGKHTPARIMILVALSRKQACRKGNIWLQGLLGGGVQVVTRSAGASKLSSSSSPTSHQHATLTLGKGVQAGGSKEKTGPWI